jgi:hypothetical protein
LGGWSLSAVGAAQTGLSFNITINRANTSVPGGFAVSGEERPDYVPGVALTPPGGCTPSEWVNPAAFSTPASGTFGDLGRNAFRAPAISGVDLAVAKNVSFCERIQLHFRGRRPSEVPSSASISTKPARPIPSRILLDTPCSAFASCGELTDIASSPGTPPRRLSCTDLVRNDIVIFRQISERQMDKDAR